MRFSQANNSGFEHCTHLAVPMHTNADGGTGERSHFLAAIPHALSAEILADQRGLWTRWMTLSQAMPR